LSGPDESLRTSVAMRVQEIDEEVELEALVGEIRSAAETDVVGNAEELLDPLISQIEAGEIDVMDTHERAALRVLATIDSWLSLASYAVVQFYATREAGNIGAAFRRRPGGLLGWAPGMARGVALQLRLFGMTFRRPLEKVARLLGATSFAVDVGLPHGASVGLSWMASDVAAIFRSPSGKFGKRASP
jgi:hypothetical protein